MTHGIIEKLTEKGFGFIKVDGYEKGIFFHASKLRNARFDDLRVGDEVTIETIDSDAKGTKAVGIELV